MPRTCYIWDGDNVAAEVDENGDTIVDYTYMPKQHGELVSQRRWDGAEWQTRYHQYDALGSTIALTDETGAVTDTYTYDAWGNEIAPTSTFDNPFRWVGKYGYYWNDDLRYYYVRARDYTPLTSRWLSRDPLGLDLDANPYRYVGNGPATLLDASGLSSVCGDANVWYSQNLSTLNDLAAWNVFTVLSLILVSDLKQEIADANLQGKVSKFKHTGGFIIPVANGNETGIYASYAFFIAFDIC
ncbi:MAG: RHS repeat-associated core domain-containing protein, partial [Planctomycetia bacterium]|nr:RHS repeat-associated core domain-containing protein [Planctomycetia bacterium]